MIVSSSADDDTFVDGSRFDLFGIGCMRTPQFRSYQIGNMQGFAAMIRLGQIDLQAIHHNGSPVALSIIVAMPIWKPN